MHLKIDDTLSVELLEAKHSHAIYELASTQREYLREWLTWVDQMESEEFISNYITGSQQRNSQQIEHAFVILENGQVVGRIGVYKIDNFNKIGEIGYWVGEGHQGKGIATRACRGIINFCFSELELNRIEIICGKENYKSQLVPERLKFTKEGILRQGAMLNGVFHDLVLYSMLREEWIK